MAKKHLFRGPIGLTAAALLAAAGCAPAGVVAPPAASPSATPASSAPSASPSAAPSVGAPASASPTASPSPAAPAGQRSVTGLVADINRDPMPGATVVALNGDEEVARVQTDKDGRYAINLPAGEYVLRATREGFTTRSQAVGGAADVVLNFGATEGDQANPHFLADTPEVDHVVVEEAAPAGPMKLRVYLSEPLPADSQKNFAALFELRSSREEEFLRVRTSSDDRLTATGSWDADGRVFTFEYAGPYLASGIGDVEYAVRLDQDRLDTQDPVTQEFEYDEMEIADAAGNEIGRGRADYAFKKPAIFPPALEMLTDPDFGFYVQDRRWRLSHDSFFSFKARRDDDPPVLTRVELAVDDDAGDGKGDVLRLTFDEPMSVARDRDELEFTRLDKDRVPVILNVATDEAGKKLEPLDATIKIRDIRVDYDDPRIVYLTYPLNAFDEYEFVEVTLTPEALDPAGNPPDPKQTRLGGPIVGN